METAQAYVRLTTLKTTWQTISECEPDGNVDNDNHYYYYNNTCTIETLCWQLEAITLKKLSRA
jgi:hypothetical protein